MFKFEINDNTYLKILDIQEADSLLALIDSNRLYLKKWLPWLDMNKEVSDVESFIKGTRNQFASDNGFQAGIYYKNQLVGVIGYNEIDWKNKKTNIGYWLDQEHQGKGIITEACKAMVSHAFENLNLNKVEIRCAEKNYKSRAIPERLGFLKEGTRREAEWLYDHFVDHIVYGILKEEWPKK